MGMMTSRKTGSCAGWIQSKTFFNIAVVSLIVLGFLTASAAWAGTRPIDDFGSTDQYRTLFDPEGSMGWMTPRVIVWVLAQLHLLFAAFVLAVPMFAVIIEIIGITHREKDPAKAQQYDDLAHEFTRLLSTAFSVTSILGAIFTFTCLGFYPKVMNYLVEVFGPSMYIYAFVFFGESFSLYLYYYGWDKFKNRWFHAGLGLCLNFFGMLLMLIANAWVTYAMAPPMVLDPETGEQTGELYTGWQAFWGHPMPSFRILAFFVAALLIGVGLYKLIRTKKGKGYVIGGLVLGLIAFALSSLPRGENYLLHPINIHRLIANLCMGGSVAAAYAAYKFLSAKTDKERAHYDWMGYIGNMVAVFALLPLPFAGYYLGLEIYNYDQSLGIYMMGGILSWLFIMQAVLIGALFFAANYYLWVGMDRIEGSERYRGWIKFMLVMVTICVLIWATPKSLILTSAEVDAMGGINHPTFSNFGVMSAKNTGVNLLILTTFLSFVIYRRANKVASPRASTPRHWGILFGVSIAVLYAGLAKLPGFVPGWMNLVPEPLKFAGDQAGFYMAILSVGVISGAVVARIRKRLWTTEVSIASLGNVVQAMAFGGAAAVVVFIGVGGYMQSLWFESTARVMMSPFQVYAVIATMVVVFTADAIMFSKANGSTEVGKINWGKVPRRAQYALFFLAVSFTWLMALMGFVRSSLRKHYHVYGVMQDTSPWASTPSVGYATVVVTVTVMIFFFLVSMVIWIANLSKPDDDDHDAAATPAK
jgi:cytochrome bd-type quinol oxidase subunit 1